MIIILRAAQLIGGQALIWLDNDKEKAIKVDNIRNQILSFHSCTSRSSQNTISVLTISDRFFIIGPPDLNENEVI